MSDKQEEPMCEVEIAKKQLADLQHANEEQEPVTDNVASKETLPPVANEKSPPAAFEGLPPPPPPHEALNESPPSPPPAPGLVQPRVYETLADKISVKMDDLMSLEREIAEMHHVELPTPAVAQRVSDADHLHQDDGHHDDKIILEIKSINANNRIEDVSHDNCDAVHEPHTPIENDELIAVLKGAEDVEMQQVGGEKIEGVTIEGEGEYEIMDVVDDESTEITPQKKSETVISSTMYAGKAVVKLTREEERAMAMEQMAGLNARSQGNNRPRRRKQDIKPLPTGSNELVASLAAEWSELETSSESTTTSLCTAAHLNTAATTTKKPSTEATKRATKAAAADAAKQTQQQKRLSAPLNITSVIVLQSAPNDFNTPASNEDSADGEDCGAQAHNDADVGVAPSSSSGFKRTRIIKRKIIWDPDAPETQFSYAQLVRNQGRSAKQSSTSQTKESTSKKSRPTTPKKPHTSAAEKVEKPATQTKSSPLTVVAESARVTTKPDETAPVQSPPLKRRSQTPVTNGTGVGKRRKNREVDMLMLDEGAANMLSSLENELGKESEDENLDKPHKHLMRSRRDVSSEKVTKRAVTPTLPVAVAAAVSKKRGPKPKASSSWDYVYKQKASEDAMIIRRRSNSSYSSTASANPTSLDGPSTSKIISSANTSPASTPTQSPLSGSTPKVGEKSFEFSKPAPKSGQKQNATSKSLTLQVFDPLTCDLKLATSSGKRGNARSPAAEKFSKGKEAKDDGSTELSDVVVRKAFNVTQIVFSTHRAKIPHTFTVQMLNKLAEVLNGLREDENCKVVVMTTNGVHFCQGVDFSGLTVGNADARKNAALALANATKNYLRALATFPKPLIAGVGGNNSGFGVMQLPLFDVVIGSDKGSYETPYAKFGQLPEGYCIWTKLTKLRESFKTKLFWLGEKLHSTESALSGLVNKLTPTNKVNEDAVISARKISALSQKPFILMKKSSLAALQDCIGLTLDEEFDEIVNQWQSDQCQTALKEYSGKGGK